MVSVAQATSESWRAEYPFASHTINVAHGKLHYVDEGPRDGPVMFMMHGNPTWSFYYRHLIKAFSSTYRVVVPDHLGCGLSDKPEDFSYRLADHIANVNKLAETLDLKDVTLCVHDWGGAIGMGWATANPERVRRFVVFNTAAFLSERIPLSIDMCRIPGFGALAIRGLNAFARVALMRCVVHKELLTPEVRAGYLAPYNSWSNRVATLRFVQDIPMSESHPTRPTLQGVQDKLHTLTDKPMLIVWGAEDFCFNDTFLEEWRRRFPEAEVHRVEDAGHYVVEDARDRIIDWMGEFLKRTS